MLQYIKVLTKKYISEIRDYLRRKPKHVNFETVVPFDCDDTLVMWTNDFDKSAPGFVEFTCPYTKSPLFLKPHQKHIDLLKKYYFRGFGIMVWSAGGAEWAKEVVKVLGLEKYVHVTITKPSRYVDDLNCKEWMGNRVYIKD